MRAFTWIAPALPCMVKNYYRVYMAICWSRKGFKQVVVYRIADIREPLNSSFLAPHFSEVTLYPTNNVKLFSNVLFVTLAGLIRWVHGPAESQYPTVINLIYDSS